MKNIIYRLLFVGLSTVITVFFSEKVYWYVQGYVLWELVLYYAFPVFACLWTIEYFRVRRLAALVLVAALYAFLIEGVLTPVMYEAGLFNPLLPAYFIGWHGLLSFIFGWYIIRKWLLHGYWRRILVVGFIFGLFWGVWSLIYWLPETFEEWAKPGRWPAIDFAVYVFTFTLTLMLGHWLLGRGVWPREFRPSKIEKWFVSVILVAIFALTVFPVLPMAIFKLLALMGVVFLALRANRLREQNETIFVELTGPVKGVHVLTLLSMPVAATLVYVSAVIYQPSEDVIRSLLLEGIPFFQTIVGAGLFLWAVFAVLWPRKSLAKK